MRRQPGGWRALGLAAGLALAFQGPACAGPVARDGDRLEDRHNGGSIQDVSTLDASWRSARVDGAGTAWEGPGGAVLSWTRRCDQRGTPPVLARALLWQLGESEILEQGPVTVADAPGYRLHARVANDGVPVDLRAVVRVKAACVDDWVLLAPGDASSHVALFDRWRATFSDTAPPGGPPSDRAPPGPPSRGADG